MIELFIGTSLGLGIVLLVGASLKWTLPPRSFILIIAGATVCGAMSAWLLVRSGLPAALLGMAALAIQFTFYFAILAWRFYRDPDRVPPADSSAVVSPADGKVIYLRRLPARSLLRCDKKGSPLILDELAGTPLVEGELWQIGIAMVFTDVHVNRAPIAASVALSRHRPGKFLSLRLPEAVNLNERQTVLLDNGIFQLGLVQIASRLVRRIEPYIVEGQRVERAQRIGIIKFGSQVDVFLPVEAVGDLRVREGDSLVAGESILTTVIKVNRIAAP